MKKYFLVCLSISIALLIGYCDMTNKALINEKCIDINSAFLEIIPGRMVAGIELGETYINLIKILGPEEEADFNIDKNLIIVSYKEKRNLLLTLCDTPPFGVLNETDSVKYIRIWGSYPWKTKGGNMLGGSINNWMVELGKYDEHNDNQYIYNIGIDIYTYEESLLVKTIVVFNPEIDC